LPLAMLGIAANHAHHAATMNDLAFHTDFFDRRPNLHFNSLPFRETALPEQEAPAYL
jgi:hypothetical protein